ncbi:MAG TPA: hypothetical protein VJS43_13390, partial [Candidatus Acidoferrales bacterium]|nr:hypothetical protein [Candidatus Acidoferrales bacterium]
EGRKPNKNSLNHYRSLDGIGNIEKPLKLVAGDLDSGLLRAQHDEAAAAPASFATVSVKCSLS